MNHDATHCFDYSPECPAKCYRAQLTEDLKQRDYELPVSWANFKGTRECPKWPNKLPKGSSHKTKG